MKRILSKNRVDKMLSSRTWKDLSSFGGSRLEGRFLQDEDGLTAYYSPENLNFFLFDSQEEAWKWRANFVGETTSQTALEVEGRLSPGTLTRVFRQHFREISGISNLRDAVRYADAARGNRDEKRALRFLLICCLTANSTDQAEQGKWLCSIDGSGGLNWLIFELDGQYLNVGLETADLHRASNYSLRSDLLMELLRAPKDFVPLEKLSWMGEFSAWPSH